MQFILNCRLSPARFWIAAALVMLTLGYFQNSRPGWNAKSQFGLTCALAERGTFSIDAYHELPDLLTGDKALYNGHYYCDKSALTPMLGVPVCWVYGHLGRAMNTFNYNRARYWTTWLTIGPAAVALVALLAGIFTARGVAEADAWRAALLWLAATPLLGYAILYYQYVPACALGLAGFACLHLDRAPGEAPNAKRLGGTGLFVGLSVWALPTMAIPALALTLALLACTPPRDWAKLWPYALGGALGVAGQFIYTRAIFGTFGSPYTYEADKATREAMSRGLMGATQPRAYVAWLITFHPFMGLFVWFPLTAAALAGCLWTLFKRGSAWCNAARKSETAAAFGALALLILYNSAYFMWWGGWAYAPRHLIPALPLLALGLVPSMRSKNIRLRRGVLVLGLAGALVNLSAAALDPQIPPAHEWALQRPHDIPSSDAPIFRLLNYVWRGDQVDANWGTALGLKGPLSLAPLVLLWGLGAWALGRAGTNRESAPPVAN